MRTLRLDQLSGLVPDEWAIKNVVGGMTLLWGPTGSWKTFTAIGMAVAVAAGRPWCGCATKPGRVLYLLGEGGRSLFYRRAAAVCQTQGIKMNDLPLWVLPEPVNLGDPGSIDLWTPEWDGIQPTLIVVDTLSRCLTGDENTQEVMQAFVRTLDDLRLRYDGATVLIVHHENKAGMVRGSSVLPGAIDVSIRISRHDKEDKSGEYMKLTAEKLRDLDVESFPHNMLLPTVVTLRDPQTGEYVLDEYGDRVSTVVMQPQGDIGTVGSQVATAFFSLWNTREPGTWISYKQWYDTVSFSLHPSVFKRALAYVLANVAEFGIVMAEAGQYEIPDPAGRGNPFASCNHMTPGTGWPEE